MSASVRKVAGLIAALALSAVVVIGCGGDDNPGGSGGNNNGGGSGTVTIDGQSYRTVKIGKLTWMAENLNRATSDSWCYGEGGPFWVRDDNDDWMKITLSNAEVEANCAKYGRLYTWDAAMTACPSGWRLPDTADWNRLVTAAGGDDVAGRKLKSTSGWRRSNGTDEFGFSALPGGFRNADGPFDRAGIIGLWWSATEYGSGGADAHVRLMGDGDYVDEDEAYLGYGLSARCVR